MVLCLAETFTTIQLVNQEAPRTPTDAWERLDLATRIFIITSLVAGGVGPVGYLYWRSSGINSTLSGIETQVGPSGIETQVGPIKTEIGGIDKHVSVLETDVAGIATQVYAAETQSALNGARLEVIATKFADYATRRAP